MTPASRALLLRWYRENARDLPWRRVSDPYAIWVSEAMLQQTQVATVEPYFTRWMARFPTVEALAAADEEAGLSLWQGLGYYRRCRLLMAGARYVAENGWPASPAAWRSVPGIGRYTAGAISSIAFGASAAVVDGNVARVVARLTGNRSTRTELDRDTWAWAEANVDSQLPGDWNQALMELGATVCRPKNPACDRCPLAAECVARGLGLQDAIPTASPKVTVIKVFQDVSVPWCAGSYGVRQISSGPWWIGMWEFPRRDRSAARVRDSLWGRLEEAEHIDLGVHRHTVTNHRIELRVSLALCADRTSELHWATADRLKELPMPAPQRRILKTAVAHLDRAAS